MNSYRQAFSLAALCLLAACASVENRTTGTITVDGRTYQTVTTEIVEKDSGRRFAKTEVRVAGLRPTCNPGIEGDCERAVNLALASTGRPSENPMSAHGYYALPAF